MKNASYNEIFSFIRDEIGYDIDTQTESVIEELAAVVDLRDEFNDLFKNLAKYYDAVLPNAAALAYREGFKKLSFIRESVATRTRDPRYSMKDASAKVRAIIEEYLEVEGIKIGVPQIDILSTEFMDGVEKQGKSDRAATDEMVYAVREYIIENTPKDPELFERFSERLEEILQAFKDNWQELRKALHDFIHKKVRWIAEKQRQMQDYGEKQSAFVLEDGENVLYFGKSYAVISPPQHPEGLRPT
jgi:type I restriction enzyme R subunit